MSTIEELKRQQSELSARIKALQGAWPGLADIYYAIVGDEVVEYQWEGTDEEIVHKAMGNVFLTRDEAEYFYHRRQAQVMVAEEVAKGCRKAEWVADFKAPRQAKYFPMYDPSTQSLTIAHDYQNICVPVEYLAPKAVWDDLLERYRESILLILGIERKFNG